MPALGLNSGIVGQSPGVGLLKAGQDVILNWLSRLTFSSTITPPITNPLPADVGGNYTTADTNSVIGANAGSLEWNGTSAVNDGLLGPTQTRAIGKALFMRIFNRIYIPPNGLILGFDNNNLGTNSVLYGVSYESDYSRVTPRNGATGLYAFVLGTALVHDFVFIQQSVGGIQLARNGDTGTYRLIWVNNFSSASVFPKLQGLSATNYQFRADDFQVIQLPAPYTTDRGIATSHRATFASGDTNPMTANALVEVTYTATTGVDQEIGIRVAPDGSGVFIKILQAAATIGVYTRTSGGVDTVVSPGTAAQTQTNGTVYRAVAIAYGSAISTVVNNVNRNNVTTSQNLTETIAKTSGNAGTLFTCWPGDVSLPSQYEPPLSASYFWPIGDSKTVGTGDTTPPAAGRGGFPPLLSSSATRSSGNLWVEMTRNATGGYKVADIKAGIDAALAATINIPTHVFINLGINDNGITDFTSDYLYIVDAIHAKFPNARIYLASVWGAGRVPGTLTAINGWIAGVIAARSSFVFAGIDEYALLEGGDNGATYLSDGTHPNRAGYIRVAAGWKVVAGL